MRTIAAGEFKAKCLAIMEEVQAKRETVVLTKYGKPIAQLTPLPHESEQDPLFGFMRGKGKIVGDIVSPIFAVEDWDMLK